MLSPSKLYTIKDNPEIATAIVKAVSDAARLREQIVADACHYKEAPGSIWDVGEKMFEDGPNHLPPAWRDTIVPKELRLSDTPTINIYKSFVEQIQSSLLSQMPGLEFVAGGEKEDIDEQRDIIEAFKAGDMGQVQRVMELVDKRDRTAFIVKLLNMGWEALSHRSRILTELDISVEHNCNFGHGVLSLYSFGGELYLRAVHPKMIVVDPYANKPQDIMWLAQVYCKPVNYARTHSSIVFDTLMWPSALDPRPEDSEVVLDVWIRAGAEFAGHKWEKQGMYLRLTGQGDVIAEEVITTKRLPQVVYALIPSDRIYGHALSSLLWQAQVRVDKCLGIILARAGRAAGEKYHSQSSRTAAGAKSTGLSAVSNLEDLKRPGVQVIYSENQLTPLPTDHVPADLMELYRMSIADMERIAGLSQPFQGMAPQGITAGIAIQTLATMSSRRVSRMATHLVEALREFGYTWAEYFLKSIDIAMPEGVELNVHLAAMEESTQKTAWAGIIEALHAGMQVPPEVIADLIPGLTPSVRDSLKTYLKIATASKPAPGAGQAMPVDVGAAPPTELPAVESMGEEPGTDSAAAVRTA